MNEYPHLENAPIVEALIDIQVQLPESKTVDILQNVHKEIKNDFPKQKKRIRFSGSLEVKPEETKAGIYDNKIDGFLFLSEDEKKIFQARLDGFTCNIHKPYTKWENLREDAKKYWDVYKKIAEPISIKRIALRYINKIPLKTPFEPSHYFKTLPVLSKGLEYPTQNLFAQITIFNTKINASAIITEAIERGSSDMIQFVFDIDVFKVGEFNEEQIWSNFEELRDFKNEIFFKSITDTTLKLLK
jgi:uncharacterized protein (TIGR04255 family)